MVEGFGCGGGHEGRGGRCCCDGRASWAEGAGTGVALRTAADYVVAIGGADGSARAAEAGRIAALVGVASADVVLTLKQLGDAVDGAGLVVGRCKLLEWRQQRWFEGGKGVGHGEGQRRNEERREDGSHGGYVSPIGLRQRGCGMWVHRGMRSWHWVVGTVKVWGKQSPATTWTALKELSKCGST